MPQPKRRFFKKTKTEVIEEKGKVAVEKLQKGTVAFKKTQRLPKKEKEKKQRPYFPSISRVITEYPKNVSLKLPKSRLHQGVLGVVVIAGIVLIIMTGIVLYQSFVSWSSLLSQREKLSQQMTLWENISKQYPNYRDAYVEGEIYAYRLGDKEKEQYFLQNLQLLDPNFPITKSFEQLNQLQNIQE